MDNSVRMSLLLIEERLEKIVLRIYAKKILGFNTEEIELEKTELLNEREKLTTEQI